MMNRYRRAVAAGTSLAALLAAASATAAAKTVVTVMAGDNARDTQWYQEMESAFEAAHPDIDIQEISLADGGLVGKMEAMIAAGSPPDIGYMDPFYAIQWAQKDLLADLTPFIKSSSQFGDWYDSLWDLYKVNGGIYALPQDVQLGAIFYNKDHYDKAGLAYPKPCWTYDDLLQKARKLTVVGADNQVTRYGFRFPTGRNWVPLIWAYGGDLLDDWTVPTHFTGDSDQVASALHYLHSLIELRAAQDKQTWQHIGTSAAFETEKTSMLLTNSFVINTFATAPMGFAWDVVPFPQGPTGTAPYINARGWFLFKDSPHLQASWEVLKFFTSDQALRRRVDLIGNVPPSRKAILNYWLPSRTDPAGRELLLQDIEKARSPWMLDSKIWNPINKQVLAVVWGEESVPTAIATMKQQVDGLLQSG